MGFLRPKSRGKTDETEQKRRNRLSKPLTNKSQTNLRAAVKQELGAEEHIKSKSQLDLDDIAHSTTAEESRTKTHSHLFDADDQRTATLTTHTPKVKTGVAQLVAQYESEKHSPSVSQMSLSEQTKRRPMSAMVIDTSSPNPHGAQLNHKPGNADYRLSPQVADVPVEEQLWDRRQDRYSIPTRRPSRFRPGDATRKPSFEKISSSTSSEEITPEIMNDTPFLDMRGRNDSFDDWSTAKDVPLTRADTPTNIECRALGNLSLGSLHVTNGRASPAYTEISMRPRDRQMPAKHRDVSSDYGDPEAWEDETVPDDESVVSSAGQRTPPTTLQRNFSFAVGAEARLTAKPGPSTPEPGYQSPPQTPTQKSPGAASMLAEEYMAELPPSPYVEPVSMESPSGSEGSVLHHELDDDPDEFMSLTDHVPMHASRPQARQVSNESHGSSVHSKPSTIGSKMSSADSRYTQEEAFRSALEFQHYQPPRSPEKPRAPFMMNDIAISDSGYSSTNSIRSAAVEENKSRQLAREPASAPMDHTAQKSATPRKLGGFLPARPAVVSRNTAPAAPIVAESRPETGQSLNSAPPTAPVEARAASPLTPTKQRKKLQKLKPGYILASIKPKPVEELIVQRNPSVESYSIPALPPQASARLNSRVQQLPELEKTVRNHGKTTSSSSSTLVVPEVIRFPSPAPEPEEDERSSRRSKSRPRSKARSKSRRRSMLEFFTGSKDEKRRSIVNQEEPQMTIDDLGDVVAALGSNPYDIAAPAKRPLPRSNSRSMGYDARLRPLSADLSGVRNLPPHRISYSGNGAKFMMDDQTASEYARRRSRSIHERDRWNQRTSSPPPPTMRPSPPRPSSFNDRGGISGENLSRLSAPEEAPPLPPMPTPAQIRRMSGRYDDPYVIRHEPQAQTAHHEEPSPWSEEVSPEADDTEAPLPPPHSPRPSFVHEHDDEIEDFEDLSPAPPPPCHSPRPMDIETETPSMDEDAWAMQARAWRARRQSAGEALRATWMQSEHYGYDEGDRYGCGGEQFAGDDTYPSIPPRNPQPQYYDGSENWPPRSEQHLDRNQYYDHYAMSSHQVHAWNEEPGYGQEPGRQHYEEHYEPRRQSYYEDMAAYTPPRGRHPRPQQRGSYQDASRDHSQVDPDYRHPSPTPSSRPLPSRPTSRVSYRSNNSAISLAEELNPERLTRPAPAPAFGRYSGGLQYSYEGRDKGFGGSSGTRSVSGKADGHWKGVQLKQSYGVDLGDVPIVGVVRPMR